MRDVCVWWWSPNPARPARGYWDQAMLEDLFGNALWDTGLTFTHHEDMPSPEVPGCVVVIPARDQQGRIGEINAALARYAWVMVVLVGDEEHEFRWWDLRHPRMRVWVQTPDPETAADADGVFPVGYSPGLRIRAHKDLLWAFMGQMTHTRRRAAAQAMEGLPGPSSLLLTEGFTQGVSKDEYYDTMARARFAPCPSGPVTVDTFRMWEALEVGAIPIVERRTPKRDESMYWSLMFGGDMPPFPIIDDWDDLGALIRDIDYESMSVQTLAWYSRFKRRIATVFARQVRDLAGIADAPDDRITVLMPTSPIASHPDTATLWETIDSVRVALPHADIIVMADGVRGEQSDLGVCYIEYLRWVLEAPPANVCVDYDGVWRHQAGTTKRAMRLVSTEAMLFVEHDTPLFMPPGVEPIPWAGFLDALSSREVRWIRLHHEAAIHPEHRWLMVDVREPRSVCGVPFLACMQWSQRPHLAMTGDYRWMLNRYFGEASRTMIEDTMHGVLDHDWRELEFVGWNDWRLVVYAPPGDMKRSTHIDGRGDAPKFGMIFEYDNPDVPPGAPWPTSRRVDE